MHYTGVRKPWGTTRYPRHLADALWLLRRTLRKSPWPDFAEPVLPLRAFLQAAWWRSSKSPSETPPDGDPLLTSLCQRNSSAKTIVLRENDKLTRSAQYHPHQAVRPPSTVMIEPVMYLDASDNRKTTQPLYSSLLAIRPIGINLVNRSTKSASSPA